MVAAASRRLDSRINAKCLPKLCTRNKANFVRLRPREVEK
jgi:hypothetical protein